MLQLRVLVLLPLLAASPWHSLRAQDTNSHVFSPTAGSLTPFAATIRELTRLNRLADLSTGPTRGSTEELRLWHGFGLWGVALVVFRLEHGSWHEYQLYPTEGAKRGRLTRSDTIPTALSRWDASVAAGLLTLPPSPSRGDNNLLVDDGYSVVLEWWANGSYGLAGADNPDVFCSADDRKFLRVTAALVGPLTGSSHCDPKQP